MAHSISDKNMQFTYLDMEILICCLWIRQCVVLHEACGATFGRCGHCTLIGAQGSEYRLSVPAGKRKTDGKGNRRTEKDNG